MSHVVERGWIQILELQNMVRNWVVQSSSDWNKCCRHRDIHMNTTRQTLLTLSSLSHDLPSSNMFSTVFSLSGPIHPIYIHHYHHSRFSDTTSPSEGLEDQVLLLLPLLDIAFVDAAAASPAVADVDDFILGVGAGRAQKVVALRLGHVLVKVVHNLPGHDTGEGGHIIPPQLRSAHPSSWDHGTGKFAARAPSGTSGGTSGDYRLRSYADRGYSIEDVSWVVPN